MNEHGVDELFQPFRLPCGVVLKNRMVKSAMSDSLGDGAGNPTDRQIRLYERWAEGGVAGMIVGEVQGSPDFAEKPGNLVLRLDSDQNAFRALADAGARHGAQVWLQLGHAGAMAYPPISVPKGPSAIDVPGLHCDALTLDAIHRLPDEFAQTARLAQELGFTGVQIHAAHGFLLSQFLSPLFNRRTDDYGGDVESRMRLLLEIVDAVRQTVERGFVVAVKLNSSDQLAGGLDEADSLAVVSALDKTGIDLIDISGGTYFPGATSASDGVSSGPYFINYANLARARTAIPLMVTGGFKTRSQALNALRSGDADVVGLARALVVDPALPNRWSEGDPRDPEFPRFTSPPAGGITAWYTLRMALLAENREDELSLDLHSVLQDYEQRDSDRVDVWRRRFASSG